MGDVWFRFAESSAGQVTGGRCGRSGRRGWVRIVLGVVHGGVRASAASSSSASAASSSAAGAPASSASSASPAGSPRAAGTPTPSGAGSTSPGSTGRPAARPRTCRSKRGLRRGPPGRSTSPSTSRTPPPLAAPSTGTPGCRWPQGRRSAQVGAAAARSTTAGAVVVTLAPGQTANALLRIVQALNYPQATCSPTATTYLRVYPPNQTTADPPALQVDRVHVDLGQAADDRRGAGGRRGAPTAGCRVAAARRCLRLGGWRSAGRQAARAGPGLRAWTRALDQSR